MVLPVEDAVATLEAAVLAAAVVEGLAVAVAGLDVVVAGRDVEGAVAGLGAEKIRCSGGIKSLDKIKCTTKTSCSSLTFVSEIQRCNLTIHFYMHLQT